MHAYVVFVLFGSVYCVLCLEGGGCVCVSVFLWYFHRGISPGALFVGGLCFRSDDVDVLCC